MPLTPIGDNEISTTKTKIQPLLENSHWLKLHVDENQPEMSNRTEDQHKTACMALRKVASSNLQLYTQSDKKAQILIQVNAIMISVLLGGAFQLSIIHKLAFMPVAGQLLFSTVVILLSLRSTRPTVAFKRHSGDQMQDLLQFSDYDQMEKEEYLADMKVILDDADRTYDSLIRNIYSQAQVLSGKYRYLRWAFGVFIAGLGINILAAIGIAFY